VTKLQTWWQSAGQLLTGFFALLFVLTLAAQMLPELASAAGQVSTRSITMSSSAPSASSVTYTTTFTPATSITHPDVILDFCSNTPLVGDSCTATAGTDVPNFTSAAATGYTVTTIGSNRGIKLTTSTVSFTAATPVTITVTGVTNPSNTASFYGRILTYATGGAGSNTSASPGSYVDYGGIALSTASNISITSKVYETLTFCVFTSSCGTAPVLVLGDATTGALNSSTAYINADAQYTLATNASNGVNVVMRGTTLCRPGGTCTTGANAFTISAVGGTASTLSTGTEQFGMCADKNSSSALTVASTYNDTANNCHGLTTGTYSGTSLFGFNDSASSGGTNNAGGSQVLSSSGAVPSVTGSFGFLGDIALTTEAGIYQTSLNMVATGTF
jgi:hypothetical protein